MNSRKTLTCNLCHLPQDIFRVIFQFLYVEDLMRGEKAFLNNQPLLSLYRSSLEGFTLTEEIITNEATSRLLMSWIIDRKLLAGRLVLYNLRDLGMSLLNQSRSSIKEITINSPDSDPVVPSLGQFPSLNSVEFYNPHYFTKDRLISFFSQNPQLEIVKIEYMHHLSNEIIPHLSNSCPKIKILSLFENDWVNNDTISLLTEQRLFPHLKSLDIQETRVTNQDSLRQLILSRPLFSGLSLPYDIEYSNDFLLFYLRQVIFPSILSQNNSNDFESHSLALSSLSSGGRGIFGERYDLVNPEIFSMDILSHLNRKGCSLDTLQNTVEIFSRLSKFPSMIDSILQSQFIPFLLNDISPHDYIPFDYMVDLLCHCGVFHDYFPLVIEKYRTHPNTLIKIFHQAITRHFSLLTTEELQTITPIVLNKLQKSSFTYYCLEIISKLLQEPSSQLLVDPNTFLLSLKSAKFLPKYTDEDLLDCLKIFLSVNENYQQLLFESNLLPHIMTLVGPEPLLDFTTHFLSSSGDGSLIDHLVDSGLFQCLLSEYCQGYFMDQIESLFNRLIEFKNNKYSEMVNEMELPDELRSKLFEKRVRSNLPHFHLQSQLQITRS